MKVRHYYQNLIRMNDEELPNLPPFQPNNKLSQDELLDILLFGTPRSWQKEMDHQQFDPIEKGLHDTVDFMEGLESTETNEETSKPKTKSLSNKKTKKGNDSTKAPYYCEQHGANWTHNTKDCRYLKEKKTGGFKNKTWNRKASEASDQSKKDLAAILSKAVNKAVKKQLASVDKKRKSDDEEGECYLVDTLTQELEGFNYETMEGLTIEDDEVSV